MADTYKFRKKETLHPNYRLIKVRMTNGDFFETRSTFPGETINLEVDISTHPAWTREANYVNAKASEVAKFNEKFAGLNFLGSKKSAE